MGECSYIVGNVLVQVKHVFVPDYHLVLSLLKPKGVGVFWEKKTLVMCKFMKATNFMCYNLRKSTII